jgi:hypothetical protein
MNNIIILFISLYSHFHVVFDVRVLDLNRDLTILGRQRDGKVSPTPDLIVVFVQYQNIRQCLQFPEFSKRREQTLDTARHH